MVQKSVTYFMDGPKCKVAVAAKIKSLPCGIKSVSVLTTLIKRTLNIYYSRCNRNVYMGKQVKIEKITIVWSNDKKHWFGVFIQTFSGVSSFIWKVYLAPLLKPTQRRPQSNHGDKN